MTRIEVKEMVLRIPGITPQEAERMAAEVGQALATRTHRWGQGATLDELHLRIQRPSGHLSHQALVAQIVDSIVSAIDAKTTTQQP